MYESTAKAKGVGKAFWGIGERKWTMKSTVGKQETAMTGHETKLSEIKMNKNEQLNLPLQNREQRWLATK